MFGYDFALVVGEDVADAELLSLRDVTSHFGTDGEACFVGRLVVGCNAGDHGSAGEGAPRLESDGLGEEETHGTIKACARIPA